MDNFLDNQKYIKPSVYIYLNIQSCFVCRFVHWTKIQKYIKYIVFIYVFIVHANQMAYYSS